MERKRLKAGASESTARLERQMEETIRGLAEMATGTREMAAEYYKGVAKMQEEMRRAVDRVGPSLEQFAEAYRNMDLAGSSELTRRLAEEFYNREARMREDLRRAIEQASPIFQHIAKIQSNLAEWDRSQEKAAELLAPHGWLLPLTVALNGGAERIVSIAETKGIEAADTELMQLLGAEECHRMIGDCARHQVFARWRVHLAAALAAHERGEYVLAVPAWLLILDGVTHEQLASALAQGSIFRQMSKKRRQKLLDALSSEGTWSAYMTAFVRALGAVGEARSHEVQGNPVLNRHAIMHGRNPEYGTEKQSVQCMVMLSALAAGVGP